MPARIHAWVDELSISVTVTDPDGTIVEMNEASVRQFAKSGGSDLIGSNSLDCHPEPSRTLFADMLAKPRPNVYTIEKAGKRTLIVQTPWYSGAVYAGYVEMSIPLPDDLPNHVRE